MIFIGDIVNDSEKPGKGIGQSAVEVEDGQFVFHQNILCYFGVILADFLRIEIES